MYVVWMLAIGLVTGLGAQLVLPGRAGGVPMLVGLGLTGSLLAGFFSRALGFYRGTFDSPGVIASIFGAILILVVFRIALGRRVSGPA
jgi:uncharacterized membrane protein YeaQ/YmgE (transglycosylase-associated protein family)